MIVYKAFEIIIQINKLWSCYMNERKKSRLEWIGLYLFHWHFWKILWKWEWGIERDAWRNQQWTLGGMSTWHLFGVVWIAFLKAIHTQIWGHAGMQNYSHSKDSRTRIIYTIRKQLEKPTEPRIFWNDFLENDSWWELSPGQPLSEDACPHLS